MYEKHRIEYELLPLIGFMIMVFGSVVFLAGMAEAAESSSIKIELREGWSYHWGDFDLDDQGRPVGIHDEAAWTPYTRNLGVKRGSQTFLWFKRQLPEHTIPNPAFFVPSYNSYQTFEVYLENRVIYRSGPLHSSFMLRHLYLKWHLFPLPPDYSGKNIFFRFYSDSSNYIGFIAATYMGEYNELFEHFVLNTLDITILGILFMILGIIGYLVWIKVYQRHNPALFSFASLAMFSGLYLLIAESRLPQILFGHVIILSYLRYISYFLFAAGLCAFLLHTSWIGLKLLSRFMWQFHVVCAIGVIPLDIVNLLSLQVILEGSLIVMAIAIAAYGIEIIRAVRREPREAKIFGFGSGIFAITALYDIVVGLHLIKLTRVIFPWGLLVFLMSLAYILILRYQSEMMRLQAEAIRSARLASLGELAAGVAHEVNNPISGIIGCAELLIDDCRKQGGSAEIPEIIIKEGQRIAKITGNLLSFARKQPHVFSPVQMQEVVADALALETKLLKKSQITLRLDIPETLPIVMADRQQMQQVVINLLNNARYALDQRNNDRQEEKILTIQGAPVTLQGRQYIRIIVSDNGPGIPEDVLDKICDPFYTLKPRGEGTGLGLSISYGIIQAHNGRLFFESEYGSYTKAIIDLPVVSEDWSTGVLE